MRLLDALAGATLLYWLAMLWLSVRGFKLLRPLPESPRTPADPPLVSVIIAAKEEEGSILDTVRHLLAQSYPRLEIIAVNDRSTDETGRRLEELKRWSEQRPSTGIPLKVVHITSLPDGWLGKNHALYQGYLQARGTYLLFTDADVIFSPNCIRDAVGYAESRSVDHVTLAPLMYAKSFWLRAFVHYFLFSLFLFLRIWRANDDRQHRFGTGIGAFNLIRRSAYEAIGTHRAFALRPDDDLHLGRLVKAARLRQRLALGSRHIAIEWYRSLSEAVRGLEKNLFSGFGYRLPVAALGVLGLLAMFLFPFIGLFAAQGWPALVFGLDIALMLVVYVLLARSITGPVGPEIIAFPLTVCLLGYTVIRSTWLTLRQRGIYWRGTFYSLKEMKRMTKPDD